MREQFVIGFTLITMLFSCAISKKTTTKLTPYNLMTFYEETLPYLDNPKRREEGLERLKSIMKYNDTFAFALQGIAIYHAQKKEYRNSLHYFRKLQKHNPMLMKDSYDFYAKALAGNGYFKAAKRYLDSFVSSELVLPSEARQYEPFKKNLEFAIKYGAYLKSFTTVQDLNIKNLGPGINTHSEEYTPSISLNGKRIIFTRRTGYGDEDLYEAYTNDSGMFQPATPIDQLNTELNEGSASLSSDGKKVLITYCDNALTGYGKCDIYISYYYKGEGKGWTPPRNLGNRINTPYWESQPQFGPNNNVIYFSSDRPGGYGGKDLWLTKLNQEGEWQDPVNLGENINTPKNELLPFMHSDNETLYFTSDGWEGYGSSDLFLSRMISDNVWENPKNLGFPINTIDKEGGLIVRSDAQYAYFSSNKSDGFSQGGIDIYQYELPQAFRPQPTITIKGKIIDAHSFQGVRAQVNIVDMTNQRKLGTVYASRDGNFLITLTKGKTYAIHILREGYFFYSEYINISKHHEKSIGKTYMLKPLREGMKADLYNTYFDLNKHILKKEAEIELTYLLDMMTARPRMHIEIRGHTDQTGSNSLNTTLSQKRADAVKDYLIQKGIASRRIATKGMGSTELIDLSNTKEGQAKNRRTEIVIKLL